ncbi:UNVERIFIED_CONTAM: putative mitochondrial protein [Sesamum radiatum]|uniref:Mitochondrial protein n=1 Tax=Sesamum radiatum TaxID=300843 RepID=A0AAW2J1Y8_SESRA
MMSNFWWNNKESHRVHWVAWKAMFKTEKCRGLGFRHLATFNDALLAKQAWRIIQHPHTLVSRLFKAKYFQQTDYFHVRLGARPSLTWRSILGVRGLIVAESRWRVALKEWRIDLIHKILHPLDAKVVLSIPLGCHCSEDRLICHSDSKGVFTVKSANQLAMKISELDMPSSSGSSGLTADWSLFGNALFLIKLRSLDGNRAGMPLLHYLILPEDVLMLRIASRFAHTKKETSSTYYSIVSLLAKSGLSRSCLLIRSGHSRVISKVGFVMNKKLMEDKNQSAIDVINLADRLLREFAETSQSLAPRGSATRSLQNWQPPTYGIVKINFDGAVFDSRIEMGAGVIARDAAGECLAWIYVS